MPAVELYQWLQWQWDEPSVMVFVLLNAQLQYW